MPALLTLTCVERKGYESSDSEDRGDEKKRRLQIWR
jgi:hypothetical protein